MKTTATRVFTIVSCNYLAEARVLMRSVAENWPDAKRTVFVTDSPEGKFDPQKEEFEVVEARLTALPRYRHLAFAFSASEFCYLAKPYCAQYLFNRGDADAMVYLDADMLLLQRPARLEEMLAQHTIVLTPHRIFPDPNETLHISQMKGGTFNAGFFAVSRQTEARDFLAWWGNQIREPANIRMDWHNDQSWLNLVPGYFPSTGILRHPGYNVAFWNIRERKLEKKTGEPWTCRGESLVLFHFSLFDPNRPEDLTGNLDYAGIGPNPALEELLRLYAEKLERAGRGDCHQWGYDHGKFTDGKVIKPGHRKYFQKRFFYDVPEDTNPFDPAMEPRGLKSLYHFDHPAVQIVRKLKGTEG